MCIQRSRKFQNGTLVEDEPPRSIFQVEVDSNTQSSEAQELQILQNLLNNILMNIENAGNESLPTDEVLNSHISEIYDYEDQNDTFMIVLTAFIAAIFSFPIIYVQFSFVAHIYSQF